MSLWQKFLWGVDALAHDWNLMCHIHGFVSFEVGKHTWEGIFISCGMCGVRWARRLEVAAVVEDAMLRSEAVDSRKCWRWLLKRRQLLVTVERKRFFLFTNDVTCGGFAALSHSVIRNYELSSQRHMPGGCFNPRQKRRKWQTKAISAFNLRTNSSRSLLYTLRCLISASAIEILSR